MSKTADKIKKSQFESVLTTIYNQPDRAWSVAIFKFLDANSDGKIDSSDLFKIHNVLDEIKNNIENLIGKSTYTKVNE